MMILNRLLLRVLPPTTAICYQYKNQYNQYDVFFKVYQIILIFCF